MDNAVFGQYIPGNSYIYRIDPRIKILAIIMILVITFILPSIWSMAALLGLVLILVLTTGIPFLKVISGLKPMFYLILFTFFIQIAYGQTGHILKINDLELDFALNFGLYNLLIALGLFIAWVLLGKVIKFKITLFIIFLVASFVAQYYVIENINFVSYNLAFYSTGVNNAVFVILRIAIIIFSSSILTFTTMPNDLNNGIESLLKPLKVVKINPGIIGMMFSITLRFIPTLLTETKKIMNAQASRGADFKESKFKDKVKLIISLLVPMFVISFKRADELADAMEARGYVIGEKRTKFDEMKLKTIDFVSIILVLGLTTLAIWSRFL